MRQLKVYPEVSADFLLKAGELEEFEAYCLLLRQYQPQTTATAVTKLVELLSTQFAGNLLDCVTDLECVMTSKTNVLKVAIVHDCQAKAERLWMTKNLTEDDSQGSGQHYQVQRQSAGRQHEQEQGVETDPLQREVRCERRKTTSSSKIWTVSTRSWNIDAITNKERSLQSKMDSITKYNGKVSMISDETDQSNRTITFGVDTAACRTVVLGNHPAARGYRVHWDSGAGVLYSTAGNSVVWDEGPKEPEKLESKSVEHKGTLDNMNKNKVLKQILIKEGRCEGRSTTPDQRS